MVRISDKKKTKLLLDLAKVDGSGKGVRFYGECVPEEKLIGFDLAHPAE